MPKPGGASGDDGAALDARVGYGFGLAPYGVPGLLTRFVETALAGDGSGRLRVGTRFEASRMGLGVELSGERREDASGDPGHALWLDEWLRF